MAIEHQTTVAVPLCSVWVRPRATIRAVVDRGASGTTVLAGIFGLVVALSIVAQNQNVARSLRFDLIPLPVGFVCGIAFLYVMGALLRWTGNRLGGSGEGTAVRAAIAYSLVPLILSEALLALYYIMGERPGQTPPSPEFASALELVGATLVIWSLPIFFACLAEVHKFSIWKALGCAGVSLAVLTGAYLVCLAVIFAISLRYR
jgi:hypothetical protein